MKQVLPVLLLVLIIFVVFRCLIAKMEGFQDVKMRPWFGYEPGYGPGWGRKGCCNQA